MRFHDAIKVRFTHMQIAFVRDSIGIHVTTLGGCHTDDLVVQSQRFRRRSPLGIAATKSKGYVRRTICQYCDCISRRRWLPTANWQIVGCMSDERLLVATETQRFSSCKVVRLTFSEQFSRVQQKSFVCGGSKTYISIYNIWFFFIPLDIWDIRK